MVIRVAVLRAYRIVSLLLMFRRRLDVGRRRTGLARDGCSIRIFFPASAFGCRLRRGRLRLRRFHFGSSFLTVSVWTDGAVVFTADGNGSANELRMFVTAMGGSAFVGSTFDSSVLTVNVWTDGAVVTADGNGSANELWMFVTAVFTADTTGALAVLMT
jgi:hypothetical protein